MTVESPRLPETAAVERLSPAGVTLESRIVRVLMFYGQGQRYLQVSWHLTGPRTTRTYDMKRSGRGTGQHGRAGWRLHHKSFGILQNIRNPRAVV